MQQFEILPGDGVLVAFAQEANRVGALQVLNAGGIPAKFLVIVADRPGVFDAAMDQFLLAIAFDLLRQTGNNRGGEDGQQRYEQKKGKQNVSLLGLAVA